MAAVNLIHRHIFGLKADVVNNVLHVDDQTVAYPAGHNIVVYSLDEKRQKFINGTENTEGITCLAVASSRRFVAVAEKTDRALVSIYDLKTLKKRKVLSSAETQSRYYVSMEFSADNQLLLTQGGAPDWILICWNWSKGKAVASIKSPLHVAMNPSATGGFGMHSQLTGLAVAAASTRNIHLLSQAQTSSTLTASTLASAAAANSSSTAAGGTGAGSASGNAPEANASAVVAASMAQSANAANANQLVTACSFSNVDAGLVCVTGFNLVRYFRVMENAFRPMPSPRIENQMVNCHTWIKQKDDFMLAGTASGDLLLFHGGEFLARLQVSPGEAHVIKTLVSTTKGVLCGLEDSSIILYVLNSETASINSHFTDLLLLQRKIRVDGYLASVNAISVSPNEEMVVATLTSNQIVTFPYQNHGSSGNGATTNPSTGPGAVGAGSGIGGIGAGSAAGGGAISSALAVLGTANEEALAKSEDVEYLLTSFHRPGENGSSHVTGMDVCVRKPIVVTCGLDKTIRVWNYLDRTCEVSKHFNEEAFSVSCHPSGLYILVGFADKLRLMNILMDDIRAFKEFPIKSCRECQFSTGGHLFAAVNGNTIQVFNFFSCELIANLRGHNGKVRCLFWNGDDSNLISAGMDGAVYQWDLDEAKREGEFVQKGIPYFSALCNREGTSIFAVGNDKMLKEIEFPSSQLTKEFACESVLGQLVLSHSQRMLFGASCESDKPSSVKSFKFPLSGESLDFQCLSGAITRLRISFDDCFLFATGEDGCVCFFEVRDKEGRPRLKDSTSTASSSSTAATAGGATAGGGTSGANTTAGGQAGLSKVGSDHLSALGLTGAGTTSASTGGGGGNGSSGFSEEILVTKSDLEEKNALMVELKNKVDELMLHNEYQLRLKDMTYNENLKDLTEKFTHQIEMEKNKYELLREDKNDIEMEYEEKIKQMEEKHLQKMQEIEADFQHKIMKEVEKYQEILLARDQQVLKWKHEQDALVNTHEKYVAEVTEDFETRLNEDRQLRLQMEEENKEIDKEYLETIHQVEQDVDEEIESLKNKYESKLQAEREATLRFKGENGIMKKKFSALQKDIEDQRDAIKVLLEKEKELIDLIKNLEKDILALKREIRMRDETIGEKEKRIYDLKKKNQELEKFKFVLDYKIKELKRQIEPRENEILEMKSQIKEMDAELELFHQSNAQLDFMIGEQRKRICALQNEILQKRKKKNDQQHFLKMFQGDLFALVQLIQSPKLLSTQMQQIVTKYVTSQQQFAWQNVQEMEQEIQSEYARQKEYLEKSICVLQNKHQSDFTAHQHANLRATMENMMLIKEMNDLRNALNLAKASVQKEKALMGAKEAALRKDSLRMGATPGSRLALESLTSEQEVDTMLTTQQSEIDELKRVIRAMESKMVQSKVGDAFPPLKGVDG